MIELSEEEKAFVREMVDRRKKAAGAFGAFSARLPEGWSVTSEAMPDGRTRAHFRFHEPALMADGVTTQTPRASYFIKPGTEEICFRQFLSEFGLEERTPEPPPAEIPEPQVK